jgi:hypothetical protein
MVYVLVILEKGLSVRYWQFSDKCPICRLGNALLN